VFTTGQKKSMLKWLDRLNGLEAEAGGAAAAGDEQQQQHSVLDVTNDIAEVGSADSALASKARTGGVFLLVVQGCCSSWRLAQAAAAVHAVD
jgi:hypothetical protein